MTTSKRADRILSDIASLINTARKTALMCDVLSEKVEHMRLIKKLNKCRDQIRLEYFAIEDLKKYTERD